MSKKISSLKNGFTLVELMIVIVIIGVLTTLIIVSLDNTKMTARNTRRLADIKQIQLALKMYYNDTGTFPSSITPGSSISKGGANYMLRVPSNPKPWPDNGCPDQDYQYMPLEGGKRYMLTFCLGDTTDDLSKGSHIATSNGILNCPTGYIPVPGSAELETNDFCVMKYEAKCAADVYATTGLPEPATPNSPSYNNTYDNTFCISPKIAASFSSGLSIGNVSQEQAKAHCSAIGGSLITDAQWTTIARNIEQNKINWSGGVVGIGEISRGHHNDTANPSAMADGNSLTGSEGSGHEYKRALTLLSGDTIIDFSGNLAEWVDNICIAGNGVGKYFVDANINLLTTLQWNDLNLSDYERSASGPSDLTYTSAMGIGKYTECDGTPNAFLRGGSSNETTEAGIYRLNLHKSIYITSETEPNPDLYLYGFRCVK